jgi:pimeloyl-ACP methyl ester carboxylesterase
VPDFYDGGHQSEGPLVALIHGAGGNHTLWRYQARYLANHNFRVMAFDLPGHGSNPDRRLGTVEAMADWVGERIPEAGTVIGHSLGGLVALELARTHPDMVSAIGLFGCGLRMEVNPELQGAADESDPRAVQMIVGWSYDVAGRIGGHPEPGISVARVTSRLVESEIANLGSDLRATASYEGGEAAAKSLRIPALVIAGERDRMIALARVRTLSMVVAGASFTTIARAGHYMIVESPDEVRRALSTFLLPAP